MMQVNKWVKTRLMSLLNAVNMVNLGTLLLSLIITKLVLC
jgi:pheromone shutdown protein TraB